MCLQNMTSKRSCAYAKIAASARYRGIDATQKPRYNLYKGGQRAPSPECPCGNESLPEHLPRPQPREPSICLVLRARLGIPSAQQGAALHYWRQVALLGHQILSNVRILVKRFDLTQSVELYFVFQFLLTVLRVGGLLLHC